MDIYIFNTLFLSYQSMRTDGYFGKLMRYEIILTNLQGAWKACTSRVNNKMAIRAETPRSNKMR